ncbi:hypothetical protein JAAARDRAFT_28796 [Jaapia argillacea MUCL 33604]|uniref:Uncharacterized protein n=1 Tax=Jaapia argillacea MUCL 33604 TaxID=933084 RepID=A0A067QG18_9AGAM|nr:hypothetical protein JAAARDRAFT_28796 [Jaapia argillacea MUCL 33604]
MTPESNESALNAWMVLSSLGTSLWILSKKPVACNANNHTVQMRRKNNKMSQAD